MSKEQYHELLKDGRWQRRRLEIMQRDDFKCRECGTTNDLNVHHIRYVTGRKPWEYGDGDLITLCGSCHKKAHELIEQDEQTEIEYNESAWRVKQLDGLLLYYKQIGDMHDVITMIMVDHNDYPVLYSVGLYWKDVMPDSEEWQFAGCCGGSSAVLRTFEHKEVYHHVWTHDPDEILTKEQFDNARKGFNMDLWLDEDERVIGNCILKYSERKYTEKAEQAQLTLF